MTVQTTEIIAGPFNGNGIVDAFPYEFTLTDSTYVLVYETDADGVTTQLTLTDDYTIDGIGDPEGGTVTRVAGPLPVGYVWYMRTNYPYTQLTAFASQGGFFPQVHEQAFDHLTYLVLQLFDYVKRAPTLPIYYPIDDDDPLQLPLPDEGKYLMWQGGVLVNASINIEGEVNFEEITTNVIEAVTANIEELIAQAIEALELNATSVFADYYQGLSVDKTITGGILQISWREALYFNYTNTEEHTIQFTDMPAIGEGIGQTICLNISNSGDFPIILDPDTGYTVYKRATDVGVALEGRTRLICTVDKDGIVDVIPLFNFIVNV